MISKNWKKEIWSIPNLLSLIRLVLIPVYVIIYLKARDYTDYILAASILAVSCLTDMIDGQIARRFNMITNLGKFLDPLADKLTQFTLVLCLALRHPTLWFIVGLLFVKEIFQLIGFTIGLRKGKTMTGSLIPGKISTAALFISLIVMVLMPDLDESIILVISIANCILLSVAFVNYIFAFVQDDSKHKIFVDKEAES